MAPKRKKNAEVIPIKAPKKQKQSSRTQREVSRNVQNKNSKKITDSDQDNSTKSSFDVVNTECGPTYKIVAKPPTRGKNGFLMFEDAKDFYPNLTPKEVLHAGSFGGTYFRPIKSSVTGKKYAGVWKELPKDWLEGLDIKTMIASPIYEQKINKYGVKCGASLEMWEEKGWMHPQDPYGWFMWYCRYYRGRRTEDDERQIGRWKRCAGVTGRWRNNLISKIVRSGSSYNDKTISPVVRQTLLHWAYELNEQDFAKGAKKIK